MVVRGSACEAASCTSRKGTPASSAAVTSVPQRVRPDLLGQSGAARDPADDSPGAVPVQPLPGPRDEDRLVAPFADGQVDRAGSPRGERDDGFLPPLRLIDKVRWPRSVPSAQLHPLATCGPPGSPTPTGTPSWPARCTRVFDSANYWLELNPAIGKLHPALTGDFAGASGISASRSSGRPMCI